MGLLENVGKFFERDDALKANISASNERLQQGIDAAGGFVTTPAQRQGIIENAEELAALRRSTGDREISKEEFDEKHDKRRRREREKQALLGKFDQQLKTEGLEPDKVSYRDEGSAPFGDQPETIRNSKGQVVERPMGPMGFQNFDEDADERVMDTDYAKLRELQEQFYERETIEFEDGTSFERFVRDEVSDEKVPNQAARDADPEGLEQLLQMEAKGREANRNSAEIDSMGERVSGLTGLPAATQKAANAASRIRTLLKDPQVASYPKAAQLQLASEIASQEGADFNTSLRLASQMGDRVDGLSQSPVVGGSAATRRITAMDRLNATDDRDLNAAGSTGLVNPSDIGELLLELTEDPISGEVGLRRSIEAGNVPFLDGEAASLYGYGVETPALAAQRDKIYAGPNDIAANPVTPRSSVDSVVDLLDSYMEEDKYKLFQSGFTYPQVDITGATRNLQSQMQAFGARTGQTLRTKGINALSQSLRQSGNAQLQLEDMIRRADKLAGSTWDVRGIKDLQLLSDNVNKLAAGMGRTYEVDMVDPQGAPVVDQYGNVRKELIGPNAYTAFAKELGMTTTDMSILNQAMRQTAFAMTPVTGADGSAAILDEGRKRAYLSREGSYVVPQTLANGDSVDLSFDAVGEKPMFGKVGSNVRVSGRAPRLVKGSNPPRRELQDVRLSVKRELRGLADEDASKPFIAVTAPKQVKQPDGRIKTIGGTPPPVKTAAYGPNFDQDPVEAESEKWKGIYNSNYAKDKAKGRAKPIEQFRAEAGPKIQAKVDAAAEVDAHVQAHIQKRAAAARGLQSRHTAGIGPDGALPRVTGTGAAPAEPVVRSSDLASGRQIQADQLQAQSDAMAARKAAEDEVNEVANVLAKIKERTQADDQFNRELVRRIKNRGR